MKKTLLSSFIFASLMIGCDQHDPAINTEKAGSKVNKPLDFQLQKWVGHYKGTLSCASCVTFCDECNGMNVYSCRSNLSTRKNQ